MIIQTLIVLIVSLWLCIVLLCVKMAPQVFRQEEPVDVSLSRVQHKFQTLHQENEELLKLIAEFRNNLTAHPCLQTKTDISSNERDQMKEHSSSQLIYEVEHARRKAENTVTELWYFIDSQLKKSDKENWHASPKLSELRGSLQGYKRKILGDFENLRKANKADVYREQRLQELGDLVQRRLAFLQNPADCDNAKKIVCNLTADCGFGCHLHHVTRCMIIAYALERTLLLQSDGWVYAARGWETVFEPVSKSCDRKTIQLSGNSPVRRDFQEYITDDNTIYLDYGAVLNPKPGFLPLAVPADLVQELSVLHGNPSVWWIGQIVRYLFRLNPDVMQEVIRRGEKAGFTNTIVGVHVRRTDKLISEAAFHSVEEYMSHVKEYYDQLERTHPGITRRVYLATDEPAVLTEARQQYPSYTFINDINISLSATLGRRYKKDSLLGVITDIYYLARSDYLVCTFSSQICRVAYELMQTLHGDASRSFRSLDDIYYFGGQLDHNVTVVEAHRSNREGHLELLPGDVIGIAGNHWDGFSKGQNRRTRRTGLFPSYKAEDTVVAAAMPTYAEVPLKLTDTIRRSTTSQKIMDQNPSPSDFLSKLTWTARSTHSLMGRRTHPEN